MTSNRRDGLIIKLILLVQLSFFFNGDSVSAIGSSTCIDQNVPEIIYVRGSGEGYEGSLFKSISPSLEKNINKDKFRLSELKPSLIEDVSEEYLASGVLGDMNAIKTGTVALISAGKIGKYSNSVKGGVTLLSKYLNDVTSKPNECVIIVGYSQGAHVIGDTLAELQENQAVLSRILYVSMLGDPKLDLWGGGVMPGTDLPWYRGNAVIGIHGGSLQSRKPYIPKTNGEFVSPVSSWCYDDDFVCTGNYLTLSQKDAHGLYPVRAFSQMALEIANVINNPSGIIDKNKRPAETCGPAKQDIVVMLDTSPIMRREATLFTDTPMYYGGKTPQTPPTAGEMLARSGCGDTRFAVVGYGREQDGPPRLLLDFTKDPNAYDSLMKSLYEPNPTGTYERTQFREAALKALDASWRPDAGKLLFAITSTAGSGPVGSEGWRGWERQSVQNSYMQDTLSQQIIKKAREHDAIILGVPVVRNGDGFQASNTESHSLYDAQKYLRFISSQTGGYMWVKQVPNYGPYSFKFTHVDQTINYAIQLREKTVGSVASVRGTVGQPVTLKFNDTIGMFAAAALRSDSTNYTWHVDCSNLSQKVYDVRQTVTFTPTQPGKCTGAVITRTIGNGNGCYSCPEPFPPYMYRSIPFSIDIKPANYIPKIPAKLSNVDKIIHDTKVVYSWEKPVYIGAEEIVYVVRESDGNVLAATTAQKLIITETDRSDPVISISAAGEDGVSEAIVSTVIQAIDMRTPEKLPEVVPDKSGNNSPEVPVGSSDSEVDLENNDTATGDGVHTMLSPINVSVVLPVSRETDDVRVAVDAAEVLGLDVAKDISSSKTVAPPAKMATANVRNIADASSLTLIAIISTLSTLGMVAARIWMLRKSRTN